MGAVIFLLDFLGGGFAAQYRVMGSPESVVKLLLQLMMVKATDADD